MPLLETLGTIAPIIGSGVNFLSGLFGNKSNADINAQQRAWQTAENEKARKWQAGENSLDRGMQHYWNQQSLAWQEKMWNLQNQYNTPSAMMERYREAGLNPYLAASVGQGAGAAPAGSVGSPSVHASPSGSPAPMGGVPSMIPMQSPRLDIAGALGVSANIANQNADTLSKKWTIYNQILENGDRATAKRFLSVNPDMLSDADPENSFYYKAYKIKNAIASVDEQSRSFEFYLRQQYGIKQADAELNNLKTKTDDLVSLIHKRGVEEKEILSMVDKINEQIRTEKTLQVKNRSEASLASAKAETENQSRNYVVKQLLLNTGILERFDQNDLARFESMSSLRGWITSQEGRDAIARAARNAGLRQADALYTAVLSLLGSVSLGAGAHVSY